VAIVGRPCPFTSKTVADLNLQSIIILESSSPLYAVHVILESMRVAERGRVISKEHRA